MTSPFPGNRQPGAGDSVTNQLLMTLINMIQAQQDKNNELADELADTRRQITQCFERLERLETHAATTSRESLNDDADERLTKDVIQLNQRLALVMKTVDICATKDDLEKLEGGIHNLQSKQEHFQRGIGLMADCVHRVAQKLGNDNVRLQDYAAIDSNDDSRLKSVETLCQSVDRTETEKEAEAVLSKLQEVGAQRSNIEQGESLQGKTAMRSLMLLDPLQACHNVSGTQHTASSQEEPPSLPVQELPMALPSELLATRAQSLGAAGEEASVGNDQVSSVQVSVVEANNRDEAVNITNASNNRQASISSDTSVRTVRFADAPKSGHNACQRDEERGLMSRITERSNVGQSNQQESRMSSNVSIAPHGILSKEWHRKTARRERPPYIWAHVGDRGSNEQSGSLLIHLLEPGESTGRGLHDDTKMPGNRMCQSMLEALKSGRDFGVRVEEIEASVDTRGYKMCAINVEFKARPVKASDPRYVSHQMAFAVLPDNEMIYPVEVVKVIPRLDFPQNSFLSFEYYSYGGASFVRLNSHPSLPLLLYKPRASPSAHASSARQAQMDVPRRYRDDEYDHYYYRQDAAHYDYNPEKRSRYNSYREEPSKSRRFD